MKILRFILFPFAAIYGLTTSVRNWFFDIGVLKSTAFEVPVIAVGNLSVGGTGKTPQIEYLVRLLKKEYKIAILSRGYKRKTKGFIELNQGHTAEDVGDEPLQYFKKFGEEVSVVVDEDRTNGIQELLKMKLSEIILLDDAYQHRKVKAGVYILLTKYDDLYVKDFMLPVGNLRECRKGANRANIVIVTKCPVDLTFDKQQEIERLLGLNFNQKLFFTTILYNENLNGKEKLNILDLKNKEVILVTGIANPKPLLEYLTSKNVRFEHLKYPDHHHFLTKDIEKIKKHSEGKIIVTTEKDYVRLTNQITNLFYISIETFFLNNKNEFDNHIKLIKSQL